MNNIKYALARFSVFAVLAVFGCGGDMDDLLCVTCGTYRMTYCLYNNSGHYSCEYMNVGKCNGTNYGSDNTCGNYGTAYASGESSSSSELGSSSSEPSSSSLGDVYIPDESSDSSELSSSSLDDDIFGESSDSSEPSSSSLDDVYIPDESSSSDAILSSSSNPGSSSSEAIAVCGWMQYNPSTQSCCRDYKLYNPLTQFCDGDVYDKCDGIVYNPGTQFCYNSSKVGNLCGIDLEAYSFLNLSNPQKSYDPDLYECKPGSNGIYLKGGVTDGRDGKFYDAVLIGTQTWMAENLNYEVDGSVCYDNVPANCDTYGRLYNWAAAMALDQSYNTASFTAPAKHQGVCPSGWHLPSSSEFSLLIAGNNSVKLRANSNLWLRNTNYTGKDVYGFAALPGGYEEIYGSGYFVEIGSAAHWWTSTEYAANMAVYLFLYYDESSSSRWYKADIYNSVRCLQD